MIKEVSEKKVLNLKPIDDDIKTRLIGVIILNDFRKLGFQKRDAFINLVCDILPKYAKYPKFRDLERFWDGRIANEDLNNELFTVLENLKHS